MLLSLLAAAALAPGVALAADYPKPKYELKLDDYYINTQDYRFPSGIRILFQEDHTQPIVSVTNWIDRGSIYDGKNAAGESVEGIAHVVEHLAFRAKHGDFPKNWDVINQLGGILNASTSTDWTNYMTVAPVDAAIPLLRIEAMRLHDGVAGVTAEDVEAEKSIARNELRMGYEMGSNGSPAVRTALVHLPKLLWPEDHPYRNTTIGTHETISNIDLGSVQRYVGENYRPEFSTIAMVGDLNLEGGQAMDMIFRSFAEVEHLLMAPEDAAAYTLLTSDVEKNDFFNNWVDTSLVPFLETAATTQPEPRVDCSVPKEPPPLQSREVIKVKGMVDYPTAVAAWSLPSGYCPDDMNMQAAASFLQSYIMRSIDPTYDPFSQESEVKGFGCGASPDREGTVLFCFVEKGAISRKSANDLLDDIEDALFQQALPVDQILKKFMDNNLAYSKLSSMSGTLNMTDNIASLYGRSFFVANHAHYTGMPTFFSDNIAWSQQLDMEEIRRVGKTYITRDRMARLIIEPIDEEERERLESSASAADENNEVANEHRAKDDRSRQLFDTADLTPEAIKAVTVVPNVDKMNEFTLENGLQVVIMNHGEAPLVKIGLRVEGSDAVATAHGMDTLAEYLYSIHSSEYNDRTVNPLQVAGNASRDQNRIIASGSSGNVEALLHKSRRLLDNIDWQMAAKKQQIKSFTGGAKSGGNEPETWASRLQDEALFPNHPYGFWWAPSDFEVMDDWTKADLLAWQRQKWQPANAYLVIVGKVDPEATERLVKDYFSSWKYEGIGEPGRVAPPPRSTELPERKVMLFDKPIATQSKVSLSCPIKTEGDHHKARTQVIGELFTFFAFERLREEKGLTYGAYAAPRMYWGDTSELMLATVIQNSGAGFGVKTMLEIIEQGAEGKIDEGLIATNKWNVARTSVTSIQSGSQMLGAILGAGRENLDYFRNYPDQLSQVTVTDFQDALSTCRGHEVVTVVGPVEKIQSQFDDFGIEYEVVDWEALYAEQLTPKELKSYEKSKAKAEAARKAEAEEEGKETEEAG
jgi:zinc protease